MDELDDFGLMERFQGGDRSALEALVERHHASLVRYFQVQSRSRETAEDLAQEVWIRVIRHRDSYRPTARFQTYLFAIARNLWIDRYRSNKAAPPIMAGRTSHFFLRLTKAYKAKVPPSPLLSAFKTRNTYLIVVCKVSVQMMQDKLPMIRSSVITASSIIALNT